MATIDTTGEHREFIDPQSGPASAPTDRSKAKRSRSNKRATRTAAPAPNVESPKNTDRPKDTKANRVLKKLRSTKGATINALMEATGWQAHSVRGFLSGTVRKKFGLPLVSETGKDGVRRYRIDAAVTSE